MFLFRQSCSPDVNDSGESGDPLTFHLGSSSGQHFHLFNTLAQFSAQ